MCEYLMPCMLPSLFMDLIIVLLVILVYTKNNGRSNKGE